MNHVRAKYYNQETKPRNLTATELHPQKPSLYMAATKETKLAPVKRNP